MSGHVLKKGECPICDADEMTSTIALLRARLTLADALWAAATKVEDDAGWVLGQPTEEEYLADLRKSNNILRGALAAYREGGR